VRVDKLQNRNLCLTDYKLVSKELNQNLGRTGAQEFAAIHCKNKIENMKIKYKQEKNKAKVTGSTR
jgi:hypothetical protein